MESQYLCEDKGCTSQFLNEWICGVWRDSSVSDVCAEQHEDLNAVPSSA